MATLHQSEYGYKKIKWNPLILSGLYSILKTSNKAGLTWCKPSGSSFGDDSPRAIVPVMELVCCGDRNGYFAS
jgi:hypothetical protein